jgi:hypothetical protein
MLSILSRVLVEMTDRVYQVPENGGQIPGKPSSRPGSASVSQRISPEVAELRRRIQDMERDRMREKQEHTLALTKVENALKEALAPSTAQAEEINAESTAKDQERDLELKGVREKLADVEEKLAAAEKSLASSMAGKIFMSNNVQFREIDL